MKGYAMNDKLFMYVGDLPVKEQNEFINECRMALENLLHKVNIEEEIKKILNSKICDIEDTIDIKKYIYGGNENAK